MNIIVEKSHTIVITTKNVNSSLLEWKILMKSQINLSLSSRCYTQSYLKNKTKGEL